jgi:hypothetical protein
MGMLNIDATNAYGLLFMTVAANYTGNLFSCDIQDKFNHSMGMKHIIGFTLLLFFVVLTNKDKFIKDAKTGEWIVPNMIWETFYVYVLFMISTKMSFMFSMILLGCILTYMLIDLEKSTKDEAVVQAIDTFQYILIGLAFASTAYGFGQYFLKQKSEHKDFNYTRFFLGTNQCDRTKKE